MATTDQYLKARLRGTLNGTWVEVKQSLICKKKGQLGVFALKSFDPGDPITEYASYYKQPGKVGRGNAFLMSGPDGVKSVVVGIRRLKNLDGRGVAQLANDALCVRLTKSVNNCDFIEFSRKVYLVATREIACGDELLVSYGWEYWDESRCSQFDDEGERVLCQHRTLASALQRTYGISVGNCIHDRADDNKQSPFDLVSFEINEKSFVCPVTGLSHTQAAKFRMRYEKVTEDGEVVWTSEHPEQRQQGNARFLDYTYVCTICDKACESHFARFDKSSVS